MACHEYHPQVDPVDRPEMMPESPRSQRTSQISTGAGTITLDSRMEQGYDVWHVLAGAAIW